MSLDAKDDNTYLLDTESPAEMARLINQERLLTQAMGGPLVGLPDPSTFHQVLDLGCGPGGWVIDVAFSSPEMEVAGVDISKTMIEYAHARARSQQLSNTSFGIMDITKPLDFANDSLPFFVKMGVVTQAEIDALYQQAFIEMYSEDFRGMWHYLSAWGSK